MKPIPTLESVQQDFQHWRQQRPYRRSPTPAALRDQALLLREQHSVAAICEALGITRCMLRRWRGQVTVPEPVPTAPVEFVVLPTEPESAGDRSGGGLQLTLTRAGGDQWSLRGEPSAEQLRAFVSALAGGAR